MGKQPARNILTEKKKNECHAGHSVSGDLRAHIAIIGYATRDIAFAASGFCPADPRVKSLVLCKVLAWFFRVALKPR
jgi:hypothetical protein